MDFTKAFEDVLHAANSRITAIAGGLKMKAGKVLFNEENMQLAMGMKQEAIKVLNEAGYSEMVDKFLASESAEIKSFTKSMAGTSFPAMFTKSDVAMVKALQSKELLDLMALQEGMATTIQQTLMQGVMAGVSRRDMVMQILHNKDIKSRYVNTYIETSRNQYLQKLHDMSATNYKEETGEDIYWKYIGAPIDSVTRDECIEALTQLYFTDAEKMDFESTYGVRWNCRHSFMQVTKEEYGGE